MGRGLVRADVNRCVTRCSDPWALRRVGAAPTHGRSDAWALLPPVGAPTRGRSSRGRSLSSVFAAFAPVGVNNNNNNNNGSSK